MSDCFVLYLLLTCMKKKTSGADKFTNNNKKYCWDMITILVTLISMAIAIYFGDWIKTVLPINMLFLLLLVQLVYVGIRWYVKGWQEARGYY